MLFMTSQVRKDKKMEYCNKDLVGWLTLKY